MPGHPTSAKFNSMITILRPHSATNTLAGKLESRRPADSRCVQVTSAP
jgi:hypothetical protein